jgi:hypothetical protein
MPFDRQQAARDRVVDEPAELLHRHVVGGDREVADRAVAADLVLGHARLEMPSGRSPRTWSTAFLTSLTASSGSMPMVNWTLVFELPSRAFDWISSTPLTERTRPRPSG